METGPALLLLISIFSYACSPTQSTPYARTTPTAQTAAQHILLGQPIDINRATAEDLEALPGIGPALAGRIVADRQKRGPFRSSADLGRIEGIGNITLQKLGPYIQTSSKK